MPARNHSWRAASIGGAVGEAAGDGRGIREAAQGGLRVLGALVGSGESLVGELRRQGVVGVDAYPYASAARTTIAAGAELYQAVADRGPGTETYQPQAPATLQAICVERYGAKDAPAMVQEALRLNPRFRGPLVKPGERIILPRKVRPQ